MATCLGCGWVHFEVSAAYVKQEIESFNSWYACQPTEIQQHYAGPVSLEQYIACFRCGRSYKNFRDKMDGDCPEGSTLQPILARHEEMD